MSGAWQCGASRQAIPAEIGTSKACHAWRLVTSAKQSATRFCLAVITQG